MPGRGSWRMRHGPWQMGGRGMRPPWWPESEAWPPPPEAWNQMRRRFMRRVALFVAVMLASVAACLLIAGVVEPLLRRGHTAAEQDI